MFKFKQFSPSWLHHLKRFPFLKNSNIFFFSNIEFSPSFVCTNGTLSLDFPLKQYCELLYSSVTLLLLSPYMASAETFRKKRIIVKEE